MAAKHFTGRSLDDPDYVMGDGERAQSVGGKRGVFHSL
jgi:hypothetical protein